MKNEEKKAKRDRAKRRKALLRAIKLAWSSLDSHLGSAVKCRQDDANEEWHARCCREYSEMITTSCVELHELAKIDFPVIAIAMETKIGKKLKKSS